MAVGIIGFGIYQIFIKHSPDSDAKKAASALCVCAEKNNDNMIKVYDEFVVNLKKYNFQNKETARTRLRELKDSADIVSFNCNVEAQSKYTELRNRYLLIEDDLKKFDITYNTIKGVSCSPPNERNLNASYSTVENQISLIKDQLSKNETHFSEIQEFFTVFKQAALEKNIQRLADFTNFPFEEQGSTTSKDDFIKNFQLSEGILEIIKKSSTPKEYELNHFSIEGTGMGFSKHGDGYWKWDNIYYGE